jgi:hypothetical protein
LTVASDVIERERYLRELSVKNYTPKSRDEVLAWLNARYARRPIPPVTPANPASPAKGNAGQGKPNPSRGANPKRSVNSNDDVIFDPPPNAGASDDT